MQLIGQYDSPFVRRVAIALDLYGMAFEQQPWSVFRDADRLAAINPLIRVPTLVMDDGAVFTDSAAILAVLDDMVGPEKALIAATGPDRREAFRLMAMASGAADKAVSLVYEANLRESQLASWVERCRAQVAGAFDLLEAARARRKDMWLFGDDIGHADIILGTVTGFVGQALGDVFPLSNWPALAAHSARCEALAPFKAYRQDFRIAAPAQS
jgi:glutathione S-transferase